MARVMRAVRAVLRESDLMAYLTMMVVRLVELHRVLKPIGTLYLHCDPAPSRYLKTPICRRRRHCSMSSKAPGLGLSYFLASV
jgi:hypothetical protein